MVAIRAMDEAEMMPKGVESIVARACCFFGQKMRGENDVRSRMSEEFHGSRPVKTGFKGGFE